ncbi:MAG: 4Fe-4S dicluster domain-containing protein, partial [Chloroflexi bacterium]|nr:4Fe-4S dicluster domain-containing protein [Chloroflexota bacterium]
MTLGSISPSLKSDLRAFVEDRSGQNVFDCYQCGKCSAGCPVDYAMDLGPRQIMRSVQLGLKKDILASTTIWLCVSCGTCSSRCPAKIDVARVMESLRWLAAAEKSQPAEKDIEVFHRAFLGVVERFGRAHEVGLVAAYNLMSGHPFANVGLAP